MEGLLSIRQLPIFSALQIQPVSSSERPVAQANTYGVAECYYLAALTYVGQYRVERLRALLHDPDRSVRISALGTIRYYRRFSEQFLPELKAVLIEAAGVKYGYPTDLDELHDTALDAVRSLGKAAEPLAAELVELAKTVAQSTRVTRDYLYQDCLRNISGALLPYLPRLVEVLAEAHLSASRSVTFFFRELDLDEAGQEAFIKLLFPPITSDEKAKRDMALQCVERPIRFLKVRRELSGGKLTIALLELKSELELMVVANPDAELGKRIGRLLKILCE